MTTDAMIRVAANEVKTMSRYGMVDSAHYCVEEAKMAMAKGDESRARAAAIRSLRYSVGVLSPIYAFATRR